ncbi:MAG: alpha/beta hydrolase [Alphaproteobacteria bacterium]|nr:alpha/beta hydrolase [Alphaproteobacteria bacterium]
MSQQVQYFDGPHGRIAYNKVDGAGPGVIWLGGFRSDMTGTKAEFLHQWAERQGRSFLRFDYSGHGHSDGTFENGSIGKWAADALAVFDALTNGPQILVGSSMGAWIATLLAKERADRLAGVVFIAPAPDFTEKLMWPEFTDEQRAMIMDKGRLEQPSEYSGEPEVITKILIEDGRNNLVMNGPIEINCPVRILQGMKDASVPYAHAIAFAELLTSSDVELTLIKNGDHSLSTPADLERLAGVLEGI